MPQAGKESVMLRPNTWLAIVLVCCSSPLGAEEPNNTFNEATVLAPGVLSVSDELTQGGEADYPDTIAAAFNAAGFQVDINDNGGNWEGTLGSGLFGIPVNNDSSIRFAVTGYDDFVLQGNHQQSGAYHVYVDVYDQFQDWVEGFDFSEFLNEGEVDSFTFDGFNTNYTYDLQIDNTIGLPPGADVDFFTFTDLTPGDAFTAEVVQEDYDGFDSVLGWFDAVGNLLVADNDSGFGRLSLITGTVPSSGTLTFAVSGFDDFDFEGLHGEAAMYTLQLTMDSVGVSGDFNSDGTVDGRDFLLWQRNPSVGNLADWKTNYGAGSLAAVSVPEPGMVVLVMWGLTTIVVRGKPRR
jgi:hypothetical protein